MVWVAVALTCWVRAPVCDVGGVEPLTPTVETKPAAHMPPIVSARIRLGVSQPRLWVCSQVLKPEAAEAAAIAHPTHMTISLRLPLAMSSGSKAEDMRARPG
jgi:hypothetical protein